MGFLSKFWADVIDARAREHRAEAAVAAGAYQAAERCQRRRAVGRRRSLRRRAADPGNVREVNHDTHDTEVNHNIGLPA